MKTNIHRFILETWEPEDITGSFDKLQNHMNRVRTKYEHFTNFEFLVQKDEILDSYNIYVIAEPQDIHNIQLPKNRE